MHKRPLPRLDRHPALRARLTPLCRLSPGETWEDPEGRHRVGCLDAVEQGPLGRLVAGLGAPTLAIQDPPYNLVAFDRRRLEEYLRWCSAWIDATGAVCGPDASLYLWIGADQAHDFQPLPDLMLLMREKAPWRARSFVTLRNQRGYGTQRNWMALRQELLVYVRGAPPFAVQYTALPKRVQGYYKDVGGARTENLARGRGATLRPGNVWVDVQQVFYRMEENVSGCYAQKPLKAIERIVAAASRPGDVVLDSFAHSGTTLLACERLGRRAATLDIDPIYCEITIRRLERYRETGRLGWQHGNPFEAELGDDGDLA